jgi:lysophospholipase L1-like esterase
VIGDSIPYGGADCGGCTTFVDLYAAELGSQSGEPVEAENLSTHDNLTSPQLLTRIKTDDHYRDAVAVADILIVSTGHNDTPWAVTTDSCDGDSGDNPVWAQYREPCLTKTAKKQAGSLTKFLAEAKKLRAGEPTVQIVTTVYNDWIGWSDAPAAATKASAAALDAFFEAECRAAERAGAVCLDNYHAFNGPDGLTPAGDLLGPDYTHPSQAGHDLFAHLLMDVDVTAVTGS